MMPGLSTGSPSSEYNVHIVPGTYCGPDGTVHGVFGHDTVKQNVFPKSVDVDVTTVEDETLVVEVLNVEPDINTI
jgi:hypothetical protein